MTANLSAYLPQDRRRALARGESLPDQSSGAVLFADISGFTAFAQKLRRLGARRGAEELSRTLDAVYTALIDEVERYGGSVTAFAGDAIFCWFGGEETIDDGEWTTDDGRRTMDNGLSSVVYGQRALACAVALQAAMAKLQAMSQPDGTTLALSLKAAVVVGNGRRFVVGDHDHYRLDVLAGRVVARAAAAEQLARPGEIIVDEAAVGAGANGLTVAAWRVDEATGERFAVIQPAAAILPPPDAASDLPHLPADTLRGWLHPAVAARTQNSYTPLLTEFRPCAALFFRFGGIDYDGPTAAMQLDAVVRLIQQVTARYAGLLVDLTVGEKGSYAYLSFGALTVHENDSYRALKAALSLTESAAELGFLEPPQIGLTQALMRVGPYGSPSRRHYGALGEGAVLAARLMQAAAPGQILAAESVWRRTADQFEAIPQPPLTLKGAAQPVRAYAIIDERLSHHAQLLQPNYPLPLVGRRAELAIIGEKLALAQAGQGQIVAVMGEAGIGKSRLLAEAIRLAQRQGFVGYGGACQSDGRDIPYYPWRAVWRGLLGLAEGGAITEQMERLTAVLQERLPHRVYGLPLLAGLFGLPSQENEFTIQLTPQYRQSVLQAMLEELLQQAARQTPLLIVLKDLHWLDPLSHDLLETLVQATAVYPVFFLLAYRPPDQPRLQTPRLESRDNFTSLPLTELAWAEAAELARAKLAQLYPDGGGAIYTALIDDLLARAQGNPFFLEELLNYLHAQGVKPEDMADGRPLELPDSLHALILSRIDQLPARQKTVVRAASVIGRRFPVQWLTGYYPELGDAALVEADLAQLDALDLTLLETAEPEAAYLFKHIITQEVVYESISFAARAELHEQLAHYLEGIEAPLDSIAHHYGQSANQVQKQRYWRKAVEAAQASFANETALTYYEQLLALPQEAREMGELYAGQGDVLNRLGRYTEAEAAYQKGLELFTSLSDRAAVARCQLALGKVAWLRGHYSEALRWLAQEELRDSPHWGSALTESGIVLWHMGEQELAQARLQESLALAQASGDSEVETFTLHSLGNVAFYNQDYAQARRYYEQVLSIWRAADNRWRVAGALHNLGGLAHEQGDLAAAYAAYQESLSLKRAMGDKLGVSNTLLNLGNLAYLERDYSAAYDFYAEALRLRQELGNPAGIAGAIINLALASDELGRTAAALAGHEEALALAQRINNKLLISLAVFGLARIRLRQAAATNSADAWVEAEAWLRESGQLSQEVKDRRYVAASWVGLAWAAVQRGRAKRGARLLGAEAGILAELRLVRLPMAARLYEEAYTAARDQLGAAAFQQAWDEGARWTLEEAVAYGLG